MCSELLKKLIAQAVLPTTSEKAIVTCQHVVTQLKLMLFNHPIQLVAQVNASVMRDWEPIYCWKQIQSIVAEAEPQAEDEASHVVDREAQKVGECAFIHDQLA